MTGKVSAGGDPGFHVSTWMHLFSGWLHRHPYAAIRLGNLETRVIAEAIEGIRVDRPVYVSGLARAGTTTLLELLASHPEVASHRYIDFPPVFTPYWWNRWLELVPRAAEERRERAHQDGIAITAESPEAFEEVLWMAFFPHLHDPARCAVLDRATAQPAFERFYDEHIRKLLAVRGRSRYVAKGNYNLTRLPYLQKLYPEARFVIAVRDPVWHIASLIKQQRLFEAGETTSPRALEHMRRVGHYEFGLDRRPIQVGRADVTSQIEVLWRSGQEVEGWALYWADLYRYVAETLEQDATLREATLVVQYEALCDTPERMLERLFDHCELALPPGRITEAATGLHSPTYYQPTFTIRELELIEETTRPVVDRLDALTADCDQLARRSGSAGRSASAAAG